MRFRDLQSFEVYGGDIAVVFHGRDRPVAQRTVVKGVEGFAHNHIAVEIEYAFQLPGEQVGEEAAIIGCGGETGRGVDAKVLRCVSRWCVEVEQAVVRSDGEAQFCQIFRIDALSDEVDVNDAMRVVLQYRCDCGYGVREVVDVSAARDVQVGKVRRVDVYWAFQSW